MPSVTTINITTYTARQAARGRPAPSSLETLVLSYNVDVK